MPECLTQKNQFQVNCYDFENQRVCAHYCRCCIYVSDMYSRFKPHACRCMHVCQKALRNCVAICEIGNLLIPIISYYYWYSKLHLGLLCVIVVVRSSECRARTWYQATRASCGLFSQPALSRGGTIIVSTCVILDMAV